MAWIYVVLIVIFLGAIVMIAKMEDGEDMED